MELLQVLTANVRLAALVEELRTEMDQESLEWAQTNTHMIYSTYTSEKATMTQVLKAKSFVSFVSPGLVLA